MPSAPERHRRLLLRAARAGLWTGLLAYLFVLTLAGTHGLDSGLALALREIRLALQYVALGILFFASLAIAQGLLYRLLGRAMTLPDYVAGSAAAACAIGVFVPAELVWLLSQRPIDPGDPRLWWGSAGLVTAALGIGLCGYLLTRRHEATLRRQWRCRTLVAAALAAATAGWLVDRVALGRLEPAAAREPGRTAVPSGAAGPRQPRGRNRVVVIGLDGATWRLAGPMIERGELPNLASLVRNGASGSLEALEPIESPRIWTSIATGKVPEKHGIEEFLVDRRFIRTATLWEIAAAAGIRVGLYDWLVTYPPQELDGFVIPGWLAGGKSASHPRSLRSRLFVVRSLRHPFWFLGVAGLQVPLGYVHEMRGDPIPRMINSEHVRADFKELDLPYLLARFEPELLAVTFYGTDVFAHALWEFMEPQRFGGVEPEAVRRYGRVLTDYYRRVDRIVGVIARASGDDAVLFVVSDHGFRPAEGVERITYINADRLLEDLGLSELSAFGGAEDHVLIGLKGAGAGAGDDGPAGAAVEQLLRSAAREVNALESLTDGARLFRAELARSSGVGIRLSLHPELDPGRPHRVRIGSATFPLRRFLRETSLSGEHDPQGVLIMKGPGVRSGTEVRGASVLDITPTALYVLGLPVGRDMDGRVLEQAFPENALSRRPVSFIESYDSLLEGQRPPERPEVDEELIRRLQSLGYLK